MGLKTFTIGFYNIVFLDTFQCMLSSAIVPNKIPAPSYWALIGKLEQSKFIEKLALG